MYNVFKYKVVEMQNKLDKFLHPKSIAVVGASGKEGTVGNELLRRILEFEFTGQVFPVNPNYLNLLGLKCYPSLAVIGKKIDLAVIAVPASAVSSIIDDCAKIDLRNVIIISSGFKELGGRGVALEKELQDKAARLGINVLGPNCLGIFNSDPKYSLDASFAPIIPKLGSIGFATQSGALASGIFNISHRLRVGINQMVSLGNQMDIDALDVVAQWENDPNISQILLYLESINEPAEFRRIITRAAKKKPVLIIKSGRTQTGAKATASHTGSLAGADSAADALIKSSGAVRELYLRNMFNSAQVLGNCALPKGNRLAILTNAGGPGIIATDTAEDMGLTIPTLSDKLQKQLRKKVLPQSSTRNPVDIIAQASRENYFDAAQTLLKSDEVDMLLVIYLYITEKNDLAVLTDLEKLKKKYPSKPIISVYMTTTDFDERVLKELPNATIPIFDYVSDAVRGFKLLVERRDFLSQSACPTPVFKINKAYVQSTMALVKKDKRTMLTTAESLNIMSAYGIPLPKFVNVVTLSDALMYSKIIGFPMVLKISSKKITHKTDVGGVIVGIANERALEKEWRALEKRLKKAKLWDSLDGVVIMQQIKGHGREVVAGVAKDATFGHQFMFGLGGIFIEGLKEVAFRPCPLTIRDAEALIDGSKTKNIIGAIRGTQAADREKLVGTLLRLSQLATDFPEITELDVNPIILDDNGKFFAVDARILIS